MTVKSKEHPSIPIIDFAPLLSDNVDDKAFFETSTALYKAFKEVGFAYIQNHSVPQDVVEEAFSWSRKFFDLPQAEKDKVPHPPEGWYHRGYSGIGREKVSQMVFDNEGIAKERKMPDSKESFEMGGENNKRLPNIWPAEDVIPGFRDFYMRFFDVCAGMEDKLLRAIAVGMGLDQKYFTEYHKEKNNQVRLLHYPPIEEELLATGKVDCIGTHSDFGTITMLFQDEVGGLEVEDVHQKGKFNPAPYIPGTIVVNIGDFLMRWSNDELRSTLHHVRTPPVASQAEEGKPRMTCRRYSIPYFISPDDNCTIDCVPGCWGPDRPKKYKPINSREYREMRLNATY